MVAHATSAIRTTAELGWLLAWSASLTEDRAELVSQHYRLHAQAIFRQCLRLGGGNAAWAEDVTQEVFLRLWNHRHVLDEERNVKGWLQTVAYRLCLDRLKHERKRWYAVARLLRAIPPAEPARPDAQIELCDNAVAVRDALEKLPPTQRVVMVMKHFDNLSQTQIARRLDLSEGYVSKLLAKGTERLRATKWRVGDG